MQLIDRDRQLKILAELLADCSIRGARMALVTGAGATGKTALLRTFAEHAMNSGALFACSTASQAEQNLPLSILDQLLRNADLPAGFAGSAAWLLEEGMPRASVYEYDPDLVPGEGTPSILSSPWINSLWELLRDQAKQKPLVIAVDNVHYADRHSLLCLSYLIRRLESASLLVVFTRDVAPGKENSFLEREFLSDPNIRHIQLELLSERGVTTMLAEYMDLQQASRLTSTFHQASGGNPLLVTALLNDYRTHAHASPDKIVGGSSFAAAVTSCLYRSRPLILRVAQALAVTRECFRISLLDELLELNTASSASAIEILTKMGLVESGRFRQEVARKAVLDGMTPIARAEMQKRAADLLHEHGAASAIVAPYLVAAGCADTPWAIRVLQEAGEQALSEHKLDTAIRYLRLAHKSCSDERRRAAITSTLSCAEWRVTPSIAVRHLAELDKAVRAGWLTGPHATRVIMHLLWYGYTEEARNLLGLLMQRNEPALLCVDGRILTEPASLCDLLSWLYPDLGPELRDITHENHKESTIRDNPATRRNPGNRNPLTLIRHPRGGKILDAEQLIKRFPIDGPSFFSTITTFMTLISLERHEEASSYYAKLLYHFTVRHVPTRRAVLSALLSVASIRQGNLPDAKNHANMALSLISPQGWGVAIGIPLSSVILAAAMMGEYQDAATYLLTPVPEAMFGSAFAPHYLQARGKFHLARSNFEAALNDFQFCGELMTRWELDLADLVPWRAGAAEACLGLGMRQQAAELVGAELIRTGTRHHRARAIALRIRAAMSAPPSRAVLLREAIELLNKCGDKVELAITFADLSQAHVALGESRQARMMARRARRLADQCGVALNRAELSDADEFDSETSAADTSSHLFSLLSDAESRVATLAAQGYTNREIASKLYVTVSTVEQHLTHVYKKLRVSSRSDLPLNPSLPRDPGAVPALNHA